MIKTLIADDHAIIREGLKKIISETIDILVSGEARNGQEALKMVMQNHYDVVLLDISMPVRGGFDILGELHGCKPDLAILILSVHPEEHYAVRALKAGASGYLTKESAPDELIKAIRKIARGEKYITPTLAESLVSDIRINAEKPLHKILSDREYQVMLQIASGETPAEIANKLFLSVKTISTYRARILQKLRMKNNADIIRYAIEQGLVD